MRKCTKCGRRFENHINFCTRCGQALPPPKGYGVAPQPMVRPIVTPIAQPTQQQYQAPNPTPISNQKPIAFDNTDSRNEVISENEVEVTVEPVAPIEPVVMIDYEELYKSDNMPVQVEYSPRMKQAEKPKLSGNIKKIQWKHHSFIDSWKELWTVVLVGVALMLFIAAGTKSIWPVVIGIVVIIAGVIKWISTEANNVASDVSNMVDTSIGLAKRAKWRRNNKRNKK